MEKRSVSCDDVRMEVRGRGCEVSCTRREIAYRGEMVCMRVCVHVHVRARAISQVPKTHTHTHRDSHTPCTRQAA